ncbi:MAG: [Fe-S]-binding protein [Planctomycetaceae bacterium]|nr:[Fe-S]-binding protein [Planctomycetaceae bacterium]
MSLPKMLRVRQKFETPTLENIAESVNDELAKLNLGETVKSGETVAITAGSRGIANIALITKAICDHVRSIGGVPVIIPSMGSHGGGKAEAQQGILEGYGITEEYCGAEIRSSMETIIVDETPQGIPVHFDKNALECDHVIVAGRVKPHTGFVGVIESGLHKMMLIGLGKHEGAKIYHRAIMDFSFLEIIRAVGDSVLQKCSIVAGLAIVENAYDETALVQAVAPNEFFDRECELLVKAKQWMPRLPFSEIALLIIDEIGKNISGSGMDTNIIGRKYNDHKATVDDDVACKRILVRGLTEETHGNACGLGMAEFTNQRCAESVDQHITRINSITGGHPTAAAIPATYPNDREAVTAALETIGLTPPEQARVVQISDTLHLGEVLVSEAFADEVAARDDLEVVDPATDMEFDSDDYLFPVAREAAAVMA